MTKLRGIVMLLILVGAGPVFAKTFTLQECIDSALVHSPRLKALKMGILMSDNEVGISRKGFFPTLKLSGNYFLLDRSPKLTIEQNTFGSGIPSQNTDIPTQDRSWYFLNLSLEQPVFTGWQLTHTLRREEVLRDVQSFEHADHVRDLVRETKLTFWDIVSFRHKKEALERTLEAKRERLRVLREQFAEGYVQQEDILAQETDLQTTEVEHHRVRNGEEFAVSKLKSLIGTDAVDFDVKGDVSAVFLAASLEEVKEAAIGGREDIKAAYARIKAAEEDIAIARSDYYPRISLQGNFITQKESNLTRPEMWALGAQLEWTLFEWGKTKSKVIKESLKQQKLNLENEELKKEILLDIERIWRRLKERETVVRLEQKKVHAAERRMEVSLEKYAAETAKLADVIEAEANLTEAFSNYLVAVNEVRRDMAHLERSAATFPGNWVNLEPTYQPAWDQYQGKVRQVSQAKKAKLPPRDDESVNKESNQPPGASSEKFAEPDVAKRAEEVGTMSGSSVNQSARCTAAQVQVGAFKSRQKAEALKERVSLSFAGSLTEIVAAGGFYKVRITGFCSESEAVAALTRAGFSEYVFVKGNNGP